MSNWDTILDAVGFLLWVVLLFAPVVWLGLYFVVKTIDLLVRPAKWDPSVAHPFEGVHIPHPHWRNRLHVHRHRGERPRRAA